MVFHVTGAELTCNVRELDVISRAVFSRVGMKPPLFIGPDTDQVNDNDAALVPGRQPLPVRCAENNTAGLWTNCPDWNRYDTQQYIAKGASVLHAANFH